MGLWPTKANENRLEAHVSAELVRIRQPLTLASLVPALTCGSSQIMIRWLKFNAVGLIGAGVQLVLLRAAD